MYYLSKIIGKQLSFNEEKIGKVVDLALNANEATGDVRFIVVRQGKQNMLVSQPTVRFENNRWIASRKPNLIPTTEEYFYLVEDLLDKQVIDINGKRLVRVNDVLLKSNGFLRAFSIDIGFSGILRRLGMSETFAGRTITLPWSYIETFDYQTGTVRIKLSQSNLNTLHPADIADILEEVGTKERLGIIESLDSQKAATAIEEADEETQSAILEQMSETRLKKVLSRMHLSEIADVMDDLNPFTSNKILTTLGTERAKKVKKLLLYSDDVAGGLMDGEFISLPRTTTVQDAKEKISKLPRHPESVIVTDSQDKYIGTAYTIDILLPHNAKTLEEITKKTSVVHEDTQLNDIFEAFAEYNLRVLPVVDKEWKVVGIISIDALLSHMQAEEEKDEAL